jgi:uncharacterized repeat protein (TIGR03803 family)
LETPYLSLKVRSRFKDFACLEETSMPTKIRFTLIAALWIPFGFLITAIPAWAASSEKVLLNFDATNGNYPQADLIFDSKGNLYGTVARGTLHGNGAVFELIPDGKGNWTEKVLYSFHGKDGSFPASRLVFDNKGNLYGTTQRGGNYNCYLGSGTVFKLSPAANGKWTETVLHVFDGCKSGWEYGAYPNGVVLDAKGNLYGSTNNGGYDCCGNGYGVVFKLSPHKGGNWTEIVLYTFKNGSDGAYPVGSLLIDKHSNLYGTTANGDGTVFQVAHTNGQWTETTISNIGGWGLTFDIAGNLYATTGGGSYGYGQVFRLEAGTWNETVLYSFKGDPDGAFPEADVVFDKAGNLYGTTAVGGDHKRGMVFELIPPRKKGGTWTEKVLHTFHGKDGSRPLAGLVRDGLGNLYGTTEIGGTAVCHTHGCGTVFQVSP